MTCFILPHRISFVKVIYVHEIIVKQHWVVIYGGEQKKVSGNMAQNAEERNKNKGAKLKVKEH